MGNKLFLIAAAAALAAGPAVAQNNVADEPVANATNEVVATDANVVTDANLVTTTTTVDTALEPAAPTESELASTARDDDDDGRGFPWGLLGLVGLIGLLGRRRG